MANTEKPQTKAESKKQQVAQAPKNKKNIEKQSKTKTQKTNEETKKQVIKDIEKNSKQEKDITQETTKKENLEKKPQEQKSEENKEIKKDHIDSSKEKQEETKTKENKKQIKRTKKNYAIVNSKDVPISSKQSFGICKFIKYKEIDKAIEKLELVIQGKKPVPMKGEIPHQKGIMSGKFPKKASEHFIKILKSLKANAENNEIETPVISEAIANFASRPLGRFGKHQKKRTHIKVKAIEKAELNKLKNKKWKKK